MGAVSSSAFVRHRNCSTYHGEFNISVSNNYFTAKMPNILKIKHFKKGPLKILNFNFLTKIVFFEKEIFLENFSENNIYNYSAEPAAKGTTTVMNMNHNTQACKQNQGVMRKVTLATNNEASHTHTHTSFSIFLLAILKTRDATIFLSFSIAIIRPKIEKKIAIFLHTVQTGSQTFWRIF